MGLSQTPGMGANSQGLGTSELGAALYVDVRGNFAETTPLACSRHTEDSAIQSHTGKVLEAGRSLRKGPAFTEPQLLHL